MNMKRRALALRCLVSLVLWIGSIGCSGRSDSAQGVDWPRWRGPHQDGVSAETGWNPGALAAGAKVLWIASVGIGYPNAVIQKGRLYVPGLTQAGLAFQCLDADSGAEVWRRNVKNPYHPQATLAVDGDRLYGLTQDGLLLCLLTANGKIQWQRNLAVDFQSKKPVYGWAASPVVEEDLLLVNANNLALALDKRTGRLRWAIPAEVPVGSWGSYATPVVWDADGTRCALFNGPAALKAVGLRTGEPLWSFSHLAPNGAVADPIVFENRVFITVIDSCALLELAGEQPRVLWRSSVFTTWLAPPVLVKGCLYGSHLPEALLAESTWYPLQTHDLPFRCIDFAAGKVVWEKHMPNVSLIAAGDKLLMLELNGTLRIAEATPAGYRELASADVLQGVEKSRTFAAPPVLWQGKIYCRNYGGDLVCVDLRG